MAKGSVQRKGSVWSFVVDLGPDPATGRRRQARRSGFATKKEAAEVIASRIYGAPRYVAGCAYGHCLL